MASALYTQGRVPFTVHLPLHKANIGEQLTLINKKASSDRYGVLWVQRENGRNQDRGVGEKESLEGEAL